MDQSPHKKCLCTFLVGKSIKELQKHSKQAEKYKNALRVTSIMKCYLDYLLFEYVTGPRRDQEEMAEVAPAEIYELRHQIPTPVYWQQQQFQHPDHHADTMQPKNSPRFIFLS